MEQRATAYTCKGKRTAPSKRVALGAPTPTSGLGLTTPNQVFCSSPVLARNGKCFFRFPQLRREEVGIAAAQTLVGELSEELIRVDTKRSRELALKIDLARYDRFVSHNRSRVVFEP